MGTQRTNGKVAPAVCGIRLFIAVPVRSTLRWRFSFRAEKRIRVFHAH